MPELPEVEIVTRNLREILKPPFQISAWEFRRADLRFKIPKKDLLQIMNQPILAIHRRAKYILFELQDHYMISHLGMTGSWRAQAINLSFRKHDHLAFQFNSEEFLVYEDVRRFGFIEVCKKKNLHVRFKDVGVEPLAPETDFKKLTGRIRLLNAPIKNALMNQKLIVGVGNIYASEILFKAGVSPLKKCSAVSIEKYNRIWSWTKIILTQAIEKGGSTIENYKNSFGQKGEFQNQFAVYGKESEYCDQCSSLIKSCLQAGRRTFWCSHCQK